MNKLARRGIFLAFLCLLLGTPFTASQKSSEVTLVEGTRISLQLNDPLSTKQNKEGDIFTASVIFPLSHGDREVVPKGSIVTGSVSRVVRPGRFRGRALMDILFHSIRIGKWEQALAASLVTLDGEANSLVKSEGHIAKEESTGKAATQIAKPALAGAGIGALADGQRGAAIGSGVGAVIGIATIFTTRGRDLEIPRGSTLEIVLHRPLVVPLDRDVSLVKTP